jgi:hypothetical protein
MWIADQQAALSICINIGNPAAMSLARFRPVALRPRLSTGLP